MVAGSEVLSAIDLVKCYMEEMLVLGGRLEGRFGSSRYYLIDITWPAIDRRVPLPAAAGIQLQYRYQWPY